MAISAIKINERFSYANYCVWPANENWELIDGHAWNMASPNRLHQDVVGEIFVQLKNALRGHQYAVYIAPFDVRLPEMGQTMDDNIYTVVQPDVSIFCDRTKLDDKGACGAPNWIIEVLSSSTSIKDHTIKRDLYARHGVNEYWLIHPLDRILTIYRRTESTIGQNHVLMFDPPQILAASGVTTAVSVAVSIDWNIVFTELRTDCSLST